MGSRVHQRLKAVLPVRVTGKASDGTTFDELTYTLDISRTGVRLVLPKEVAKDSVLTLTYRQRKSTFKVMWVDLQTGGRGFVGGLAAMDASVVLWSELKKEEKENYRDDFVREERERQEAVKQTSGHAKQSKAAASISLASANAGTAQPTKRSAPKDTASQIMELTSQLLALETELQKNTVDATLLKDFRIAVDKTRETAWTAQQRLQIEKSKADGTPLPLISIVNNERLATLARLCTEFMEDFSKADLALDEQAVTAFLTIAEQIVFELGLAVS